MSKFTLTPLPTTLRAAAGSKEDSNVAIRMVRPPYSRAFIPCTCNAVQKDDCLCIRAWLDAQRRAA